MTGVARPLDDLLLMGLLAVAGYPLSMADTMAEFSAGVSGVEGRLNERTWSGKGSTFGCGKLDRARVDLVAMCDGVTEREGEGLGSRVGDEGCAAMMAGDAGRET